MASYNKFFTHLKKEKNQNFLLIAHERPDGDTIAAILAIKKLLEFLGKKVTAVSSQGIPEVFKFLPGWRKIKSDFLIADFETIILLDNGDLKRTGYLDRILLAKSSHVPIINIDHHPKNDIWKLAKINIVNEKVPSTCEIIYDIFLKLGVPIDRNVATMLLTGIYTDTGGFQHSNTNPSTLKTASELLSRGARLKQISENVSNSRSVAMLKLWGIALDRIQYRDDLKLVYSIITRKDLERCQARDENLAGVVNLISTIPGEQATLLLYELPDGKIKGSLRTESSKIDVSRIAGIFGGGGHKKASGFVVDGRLHKTKNGWKII
ncbi:hypothetical protein COX11_00965 [Candidatus Berkelbacteria bacterium CG23_combo_of_CG06-09_8_20_14_all_41_73]|uniref:Uncharacterized protein n=3 Tax=Candidatus Berkelbacteria TaxID=1618330 RepID=A0A2H0B039_9BACT|nr:MAG: hypothetical protein COX11_00965 [Candidatus Berkelbacteria bacterium CG23_combo_of_CG06-09_8_20_14_all_41_73]PIR27226.1 MAG: hypothetical protein COV40_02015 [Candidatus Berkelbacteria bacterium CG11_big_fil_rev_8_21_14_0_20_42_15]PIZ27699.1 MAG: bifunctional oligoribonuclease/PAP phosphatase NrnA [Candidatus Berkelbacteria bacterium CG_4_10_14_0_8_um_filter_42_34]